MIRKAELTDAGILEIYGIDCIDERFIDGQLYWLNKWQDAMADFADTLN